MDKNDHIKVWVDGAVITELESRQSIFTHALHYGTSVYDGIRFYNNEGKIYAFRLEDHIDRLFYSAHKLGLKTQWSPSDIIDAVIKIININKIKQGYIRPIIFSGSGLLTMDTRNRPAITAIIAVEHVKYLPKKMISLKIVSIRRPTTDAFHLKAKMGGVYVNSILAHQEATDHGADEALMLTHDNKVAEGPGENIFIVKNNIIYTPPSNIVLPGITRDTIFTLCQKNNVKCVEVNLSAQDIYTADECFLTGTAAEITPVSEVDGHVVSSDIGALTSQLQQQFWNVTRAIDPIFRQWNTLITHD